MVEKTENGYFNRELSWLSFNHRVLQEAKDPRVPVYERLKFLAIYSSNLDEFIRVRVAFLRSLMEIRRADKEELGYKPGKLLDRINAEIRAQQKEFEQVFQEELVPELQRYGMYIITGEHLLPAEAAFVKEYFHQQVEKHVVTIPVCKGCRKPFLKNSHLYMVVKMVPKDSDNAAFEYVIVSIPSDKVSRFLTIPERNGHHQVMLLGDVLRIALPDLYPDKEIISCHSIKLSRDAELYLDEYSGNLVEMLRKSLRRRATGLPCRFMFDSAMPVDTLLMLMEILNLHDFDLIPGTRYHNFSDFFRFPNPDGILPKFEPQPALPQPRLAKAKSFFALLKKRDVGVHYPYQRFDHLVDFISQAATDPAVQEIKMTLYRVTEDSPVLRLLIDAAKAGKEITVFFEVKARFDERTNLFWAEKLEQAGARVLYSFPDIKVHAKLCLITRDEPAGLAKYGYFSTGNFNEITARIYADDALFTADTRITNDVAALFSYLEGETGLPQFEHLLVAPNELRHSLESLIDFEINEAQHGRPASITLKLNNLEDRPMIDKLYEASRAGVRIRLIIRGICCLVPGVKGMSENIKVVSIVGRYLEHSRIYIFHHGGARKMYFASADWMRRNLSHRIEVAFPVYDAKMRKELSTLIKLQLSDNVKARKINRKQNNPYRLVRNAAPVNAQLAAYEYFKQLAMPPSTTNNHKAATH